MTSAHLAATASADLAAMEALYDAHGAAFITAIDPVSGDTHAHVSARAGRVFLLRWLWRRGLDVSVQNKLGNSAAHEAALHGHLATLQWLEMRNVSLHLRNHEHHSVMHYAAHGGHVALLAWLAKKDPSLLLHCDKRGNGVVHYAASKGSAATMQWLADANAPLKARNDKGQTLVHIAAAAGNVAVLAWCDDHDLDMNAVDLKGQTPAHLAARRCNVQTTMWLGDHGCNLFALDYAGCSALDVARQGSLDTANELHAYLRRIQNSNQLWVDDEHEPTTSEPQVPCIPLAKNETCHSSTKSHQAQLTSALLAHNITDADFALTYLASHFPETLSGLSEHLDLAPAELASTLASIAKWRLYHPPQGDEDDDNQMTHG
ncbi:hypothetical protein SDRG_06812 [Saprolegnia diclina VS20]|uniref:Uncharacterized protein n=1 Tax=Saprolegnia diclina (strain VS20) TaxID=1156394 RepID=T0QLE2_SAPDV|nr:hypothetical protein SDRG_06812 [Saprolegnia diclina VS20]EQC35521.1 hypothetical protein SDRG_06812 [Saprolegnia diclina VS20]|eukprot:XP_008610838.1 hypothetical protein SDRG_06812 [Saprolegnia diclina VS20]